MLENGVFGCMAKKEAINFFCLRGRCWCLMREKCYKKNGVNFRDREKSFRAKNAHIVFGIAGMCWDVLRLFLFGCVWWGTTFIIDDSPVVVANRDQC